MIVFGIIGGLVIALIFFVLRVQSAQGELNRIKSELKSLQKHTKFSLGSIMLMSKQLTHSYRTKLDTMRRHGILHGDDLIVVQFMVENVEYVVMQCCEKHATVEEALKQSLQGFSIDMATVQQYIARQSVDVRVPWSKNTLDGYLAACNNLLMAKGKVTESEPVVEDISH
jgi:hypothetical protein